MRLAVLVLGVLVVAAVPACTGGKTKDVVRFDAAVRADAARPDAVEDSGAGDVEPGDGRPGDAGRRDSGLEDSASGVDGSDVDTGSGAGDTGAGDTGIGVGDSGTGAGDSGTGAGDSGTGAGDSGIGTGDSGVRDTGIGTGDSGIGAADTGTGAGDSGTGAGDSGTGAGDSGTGAGDSGLADTGSRDSGAGDTGPSDSGPIPGTILILGSSPSAIFTAELTTGTWTTGTLADSSNDPPALAMTASTHATGVIRSTASAGELRSTSWTPGGSFTAFTALGPGITTRARPSLAGSTSTGRADLAFHGDDFKHYFASHLATWSPAAEPIGGTGPAQSFGPSPPALLTLGSDDVVAFAGNDGDLYDQTRTAGTWQPAHGHALGNLTQLTPAICELTLGPDLLIVFVRSTDARLAYTARVSSTWTAQAEIHTDAFSNDPPALLALPDGDALVVFRGQDTNIYWSYYTAGATWSAPAPLAAANYSTPSTPALAAGTGGGSVAELAFVNSADGAAYHARFSGGAFTAPILVGGTSLTAVAIAAAP